MQLQNNHQGPDIRCDEKTEFHCMNHETKQGDCVQFEHTINFFIYRGIRVENTECMDKFIKLDSPIFPFVEKIKNLKKKQNSLTH